MCILHQYHKASGLKVCTAMCRSEKKYLINSKWWHPRFSPGGAEVFCRERIWNNYVEIQWKGIQVIFIILLCTGGYNSLGDPTRQNENTSTSWSNRKADSMCLGGEHKTKLNYASIKLEFFSFSFVFGWSTLTNYSKHFHRTSLCQV